MLLIMCMYNWLNIRYISTCLSHSLQINLIQQIDVVFYIYIFTMHMCLFGHLLWPQKQPSFLLLDADPQVFEGPTCGSAGGLVLNFDYFVAWFSVSGALFLSDANNTNPQKTRWWKESESNSPVEVGSLFLVFLTRFKKKNIPGGCLGFLNHPKYYIDPEKPA